MIVKELRQAIAATEAGSLPSENIDISTILGKSTGKAFQHLTTVLEVEQAIPVTASDLPSAEVTNANTVMDEDTCGPTV
jgi:hypothetical protein